MKLICLFILGTFLVHLNEAVVDCSGENCMCVWNSLLSGLRLLNGIYDIVDSSKTGQDRRWLLDDWDKINPTCSVNKTIWHSNRWYIGPSTNVGSTNGNAFCQTNNLEALTSADCETDEFYMVEQVGISINYIQDEDVLVYFGKCPELSDVCSTIRVDAPAPYDFCNGYYDAISPPNDFVNEINIFENQDTTAANHYMYFDHNQFRWLCGGIYRPCSNDFSIAVDAQYNNTYFGNVFYKSGQNEVGTPSWFSTTDGSITISSGGTFTVSDYGNQTYPHGTATFTCNPPSPTMDPTTAQPTSPTTASPTTVDPTTSNPTTAQPTTLTPTTADPTTSMPTRAEPTTSAPTTSEPTTAMPTTSDPTTDMPTTAMPTTAEPTTLEPTQDPLEPGQTREPSENPTTSGPTTADPTTSDPTTDMPTTGVPTTGDPTTGMPSRSPLEDGKTYGPTSDPTSAPTSSAPTTAEPTPADPTTTMKPTESPTEYERDSREEPGTAADARKFSRIAIALLFVYLLFI